MILHKSRPVYQLHSVPLVTETQFCSLLREETETMTVMQPCCCIFLQSWPCAGYGLHTAAWCPQCRNHSKKREKENMKGRVSADTDTTTHFKWITSDDWEDTFFSHTQFRTFLHIKPWILGGNPGEVYIKQEKMVVNMCHASQTISC